MPRTAINISFSDLSPSHFVERRIDTDEIVLQTDVNLTLNSRVESRSTVNTPNFRAMRGSNRDDLPMNPFTYTLRNTRAPFGTSFWQYNDVNLYGSINGVLPYGTNLEPRGISSSHRDSIDSGAINKSLADLKDQRVNLGVAFAERKLSADLILDTAKKLGTGWQQVRRLDVKGALNTFGISPKSPIKSGTKSAADLWLQLRYGWDPLIKDIYGAAEQLAVSSIRPTRFRVSSSKSFRWNLQTADETWNGVPVTRTENGIYSRKYVYVFSYSHEGLHSLSNLGITNPLSIAWEVTPFSFVVDWAINIGAFIDAFDASLGLTFEKGCTTSFEKCIVNYHCKRAAELNPQRWTRVSGSARKTHVDVVRGILNGFPLPSLPRFDLSLTQGRGLNALALIRQHFNSKK